MSKGHQKDATPEHPSLSLLRTCKQVHTEAALLPFALNTFLFGSAKSLYYSKSAFFTKQWNALAAIELCAGDFLLDQAPDPNLSLDDILFRGPDPEYPLHYLSLKELKGLRSLSITLEYEKGAFSEPAPEVLRPVTTFFARQNPTTAVVRTHATKEFEWGRMRIGEHSEFCEEAQEYEKVLRNDSERAIEGKAE